ncbi:MAG: EAL domain-containing protein, partial [Sulfurimicrobium sp.]|nr:EAL domain-containing protein [Sulfurimicrobium sp.]
IFLHHARRTQPYDVNRLLSAVVVMALSELCFTLYSEVTDIFNLLGHVYKVIAYGLLYRAVFVDSVHEPYTRLHQSEHMVWREKERAQVTLESIGDAVITTDAAGRVNYLNPVAEELTGWSNAEATDLPLPQVFLIKNETTRKTVENPLEKCLREGIVVGLANHTVLIRRDGTEFAIEDSAAPIRDRDGKIVGAVMVFHDVTLKRSAQGIVRENEERLRTLINALPDVIVLKDEKNRWLEANAYAQDVFGLEDNAFRGKTDVELATATEVLQGAVLAWAESDNQARKSGQAVRNEEVLPRSDGGELTFDVIKVPLFHPDGRPRGLVTVGRDVTETKRLDAEIRQLAAVLEATPDYVNIIDRDGRIRYMNRAFSEMFATRIKASENSDVLHLIHPAWAQIIVTEQGIPEAVKKGVWLGESAINIGNDSEIPVSQVITAHKDEKGKVIFLASIMRDISERKQFENQLSHMTQFDSLTGLPNRLLFQDRLELAIAHAHRSTEKVGVMLVDLDRFKNVNDTLGHTAGDILLHEVASRLRECARQEDTVARFGADEFTLILPCLAQAEDAVLVAQKIGKALASPFIVREQEIFITASIGIAVYPDDEQTVDGLVKDADAAMYQAKSQGRNSYHFYTPDLNHRALERLAMENSLRHALERDELELHYQPRISLETGRITGIEALLRWNHPDRGLIPPARFIPIAEETGLIVPIGEWVLHTACTQNKAWQNAGIAPINVAVNLSVRQFTEPGLLEMVDAALKKSGLDARYLDLELTESLLMQDHVNTQVILSGFKQRGILIAMDDFGTGFSSLSYLKRFPIDQLKIDQSFVRGISTDTNDAAIVTAIIAMAHSLNIQVVAEGVETAEQLAFLRAHECEEMQGYFFSRPLPAKELEALLCNGKTLAQADN